MVKDKWGREIIEEPFNGSGMRYRSNDGTICTAMKPADPVAALAIFNANPPPKFQTTSAVTVTPADPARVDEILVAMESLNPSQATRLSKILSGVK